MPEKKDYYGTLGVDKNATPEDLKKAYRKLVKEWHPDKHLDDDKKKLAEEKFKEIQEAYEVLNDPEKKKLYDRFGFIPNGGGVPNQNGAGGAGYGGFEDVFRDIFGGGFGGGFSGGDNVSDFFDMFFGGEGRTQTRGRQSNPPMKGEDIHINMSVEMKDLLNDIQKNVEYNKYEVCTSCRGTGAEGGTAFRTCPRCNGEGQVREEQRTFLGTFVKNYPCPTCSGKGKVIEKKCPHCNGNGKNASKQAIQITIPAGIEDGVNLRYTGRGHSGMNGGPNGDILIHVKVVSDPRFVRSGSDLETEVTIDYLQAVLGGVIKIPTLEGDVNEKIPDGTNPGTVIRLRNMGLPNYRTKKRGDLFVNLKVKITKPSLRERKLLKELANMKNLETSDEE